MRSVSTFTKFTFIVLAAVVLGLAAFSRASVQAAQATDVATMEASMAATSGSTMTFPACPPATVGATQSATMATEAASMAATTAATPNANPAYLGITAEQVDSCGVRVVEVTANGPAAQAGLQADDIIVGLDGQATPDINGLRDMIRAHVPGDKVVVTVERGSQQMNVNVTLSAVPTDTTGTVEAGATPAATP